MASTHLVRAVGYIGVLAILPLIGLSAVFGWATGRMNSLSHGSDWWLSWMYYAMAATLFAGMVWLLARIRATTDDGDDE
jgi:hypothetical protein